MMRPSERAFTVALLVFAFALRVIGLAWGQPDPAYAPSFRDKGMIHEQTPLHPDEYFFAAVPFQKVLEPQSNFTFYENPSFLVNVSYVLARFSGVQTGLSAADRTGYNERYYAPFTLYVLNRIFSALGGLLTVAATYGIARRIGGARAALVAGLLTTFSLPLIAHASYGTTSSLATGFATLSWFFAVTAVCDRRLSVRYWSLILSGIMVGLAMGNRYNAAVAALGVLGAGLWQLRTVRRTPRQTLMVVGLAWAAFPATFVLTTPGAVLDTAQFLSQVRYVSNMYMGTGLGSTLNVSMGRGLALEIGFAVFYGVGIVGFALILPGLISLRHRPLPQKIVTGLLVLYIALYALLVMRTLRPASADHLTLLILPSLAVLAGLGAEWLTRRARLLPCVTLIIAVLLLPVYLSVVQLRIITTSDNREIMQTWIYDHLPRGSRFILVGGINVALDPLDYGWNQLFMLPEQVKWQEQPAADYLLVSEAFTDQYRKMGLIADPDLPANVSLMLTVYKPPRLGNEHPVYTADYFHSPTLSLYCLNESACDATIAAR